MNLEKDDTHRDVEDVVDEGAVGDGVVPAEGLQRRVADRRGRRDVDRGLVRPHRARPEVGAQGAPVVRAHGADVPELGAICLYISVVERLEKVDEFTNGRSS